MFKWAKMGVAGFEDLSPLDQKAILRRTVAELVMLGFARASIAYDGMSSPLPLPSPPPSAPPVLLSVGTRLSLGCFCRLSVCVYVYM